MRLPVTIAAGWLDRLHTNAAHHRLAMERVLGAHADRAALAQQVQQWQASELEQAVIDAGGCAAEMRSAAAWQQHPQARPCSANHYLAGRPHNRQRRRRGRWPKPVL